METNTIIIYIACICFLFLFGRIFILPVKSILKLILNSCIGALMIYLINLVGGFFEFHIGINYITAIFTGILGVPRSYFVGGTKIGFECVRNSLQNKSNRVTKSLDGRRVQCYNKKHVGSYMFFIMKVTRFLNCLTHRLCLYEGSGLYW